MGWMVGWMDGRIQGWPLTIEPLIRISRGPGALGPRIFLGGLGK